MGDIFNNAIKKYGECGAPVSNSFIDAAAGIAGVSHAAVGYGWYAHTDFKRKGAAMARIDVYSATKHGIPGNFAKITKYASEGKSGCPNDLF